MLFHSSSGFSHSTADTSTVPVPQVGLHYCPPGRAGGRGFLPHSIQAPALQEGSLNSHLLYPQRQSPGTWLCLAIPISECLEPPVAVTPHTAGQLRVDVTGPGLSLSPWTPPRSKVRCQVFQSHRPMHSLVCLHAFELIFFPSRERVEEEKSDNVTEKRRPAVREAGHMPGPVPGAHGNQDTHMGLGLTTFQER